MPEIINDGTLAAGGGKEYDDFDEDEVYYEKDEDEDEHDEEARATNVVAGEPHR